MPRLLSTQRLERRRHRRRVCNESVTSMSKPEKGNSKRRKRPRYSGPNLPEDIWCHVHSLLPIRDAARAACVSHMFLSAWRCYPNLIFTKKTLSLKQNACREGDIARAFTCIVDQILKKHTGNCLKTLKLDISHCHNLDAGYLNNWLQIAITPRVENLILELPLQYKEGYNFPCSLLSGGNGNSIQRLHLRNCAFRPTFGIGCFRSLTKFYLFGVRITGEELGCLLSNAFALEQFELSDCSEIICLKIPCVLQRLSCVTVSTWKTLQMIESKAPNLSTFNYFFIGDRVQLSLGSSQVKKLSMECIDDCNLLHYAITKLPYITPNVETLNLSSLGEEMFTTPTAAAKFLHLKHLEIYLDGDTSQGYDYLSLISFLDASPVLETFIIGVHQGDMSFDSVFGDASHLRQVLEHKHDSLKNVKILGFCSAKSMVELTCHILENTRSLECITLDTVFDWNDGDNVGRCSLTSCKTGDCSYLSDEKILEAYNGLEAIQRYIVGRVPSAVKLDVRGPCRRCHPRALLPVPCFESARGQLEYLNVKCSSF